MNNWKTIWNNRQFEKSDNLLECLIQADGFDTGYGSYSVNDWVNMVDSFAKQYNIDSTTDVLEVGCGAGAFLYQLKSTTQCNIFGYDYSESLIDLANSSITQGQFLTSDANKNPFKQKFDIVFSHSVFQYFPNVEYGLSVIRSMVDAVKSGGKIVLMDLLDSSLQSLYYNERNKYFSSESDYAERYKNLSHTFYSRDKIEQCLLGCGVGNINFFLHASPDYNNSKYTFNVSGSV